MSWISHQVNIRMESDMMLTELKKSLMEPYLISDNDSTLYVMDKGKVVESFAYHCSRAPVTNQCHGKLLNVMVANVVYSFDIDVKWTSSIKTVLDALPNKLPGGRIFSAAECITSDNLSMTAVSVVYTMGGIPSLMLRIEASGRVWFGGYNRSIHLSEYQMWYISHILPYIQPYGHRDKAGMLLDGTVEEPIATDAIEEITTPTTTDTLVPVTKVTLLKRILSNRTVISMGVACLYGLCLLGLITLGTL